MAKNAEGQGDDQTEQKTTEHDPRWGMTSGAPALRTTPSQQSAHSTEYKNFRL